MTYNEIIERKMLLSPYGVEDIECPSCWTSNSLIFNDDKVLTRECTNCAKTGIMPIPFSEIL